jgi:hypothetical protein
MGMVASSRCEFSVEEPEQPQGHASAQAVLQVIQREVALRAAKLAPSLSFTPDFERSGHVAFNLEVALSRGRYPMAHRDLTQEEALAKSPVLDREPLDPA